MIGAGDVAGAAEALGQTFRVLAEDGRTWEILLGGEYRRINKQSGRVSGWKTPPKFAPMWAAGSDKE